MKDRFFLDGVDAFTDQSSINQTVEGAAPVFSDLTYSASAVLDSAVVFAQETLDCRLFSFDALIKHCLVQDTSSMLKGDEIILYH